MERISLAFAAVLKVICWPLIQYDKRVLRPLLIRRAEQADRKAARR